MVKKKRKKRAKDKGKCAEKNVTKKKRIKKFSNATEIRKNKATKKCEEEKVAKDE